MIDTLSRIAQGKFSKSEHSNMLNEKEEHSLKLYALKILASIVMRLNQFLTEEQKDSKEETKHQNSGGKNLDIEEENEEQSPHFSQHISMIDTSMNVDPKKDNYERNRLLKSNINKAASKFNLKPKKGIEYFLDFNNAKNIDYQEKLDLIVNFLKTTPTLDKTAIGDYLGEDIEINKDVLYRLIEQMEFKEKPFVPSLKVLLAGFRLPGEGQKVDRIMEKFGEKYVKDNPETFGSSECVYLLSYATMMLQTSIHNPSARNSYMTLEDFKKMTSGINEGKNLDEKFLEEIYSNIEKDPITLIEDDEARLKNESTLATSYKRKQEIFIKEGQGLAKRGHELMKEKKKTTQFILVNDSEAVGPLFESCWSAMFAVFSMLLEEHDDPKIIALCIGKFKISTIDGFLNSIKICGFYMMSTERDAFVSSLANFTGIYKVLDNDSLLKKELTDKNIKCTQAILQLAKFEGNYLDESWKNVLKVMSMINYYQTIGSGAKGYDTLFLDQADQKEIKEDPESEIIKAQNAAYIISAIDESDIDKIFSNSMNLGPIAIVSLIK
jgi:brefeldin A-inhibited guanine nucleotide-exchange protein